MTRDQHSEALSRVQEALADETRSVPDRMHRALRMLASYRSGMIASSLLAHGGDRVRHGPFAGLAIAPETANGCLAPKLLGCYEQELHPVVEAIADRGYRTIVNIGAAEGYYAVGLALRLPDVTVQAYDSDEQARRLTRELAKRHGVADRVDVSATFTCDDFQALDPETTFVLCDIEGGELDLLVPSRAPNLANLDLLVELHDLPETPAYRRFIEPFRPTHRVALIEAGARDIRGFPELRGLEHLDQLLAFWEWRRVPTPWLSLTARRG